MKRKTIDREEALELLQKLIAIDSVNPDLVKGAAGEIEIADYIHAYLRRIGLDVRFQKTAKDNRPNVIGFLRGSGGGRSLMLNSHTDTVDVIEELQSFNCTYIESFAKANTNLSGAMS